MTKTLTNLLNSIIKGKYYCKNSRKNPSITTENGFVISDGVFYIEMFTDDISKNLIINNSDKNKEILNNISDNINQFKRNIGTEIILPSVNQLKAWRNSEFCDKMNTKPYILEFFNKQNGNTDYIGFNVSCLIDFITITKAKKVYICKNSDGFEDSLCPIYFYSDNINVLLMPMRFYDSYVKQFKKSLENIKG